MIESLENRLLMRRGVVSFEGRTLTVSGTAGDDVITMRGSRTAVTVSINGKQQTVTAKDIRRVIVWAGAGKDVVDAGAGGVVGGRHLPMPCRIDGGAGNDTLYSGTRGDTLLGSTGDDRLYGEQSFDGFDYHDGGPGNDRMMYGGTMNGGSGTDVADDGNYDGQLPLVSGIERLYTPIGFDFQKDSDGRLLPAFYLGDLKTRGDKLVFRYPTEVRHQSILSKPTVRADGMLEIVLTKDFVSDDYDAETAEVTATFDTADALKRGIVVTYAGNSPPLRGEQIVLIPAS